MLKVDNLPLDTFGQDPTQNEALSPAVAPNRWAGRLSLCMPLDGSSQSELDSDMYVPLVSGSPDRTPLLSLVLVVSDTGFDTDAEKVQIVRK